MSKGNVAFLITSFPNYSETFIIDQINYLIDQGFQVTIFAKTHNKEVQLTEHITRNKLLDKLVLYSQPVLMPKAVGKRVMAACENSVFRAIATITSVEDLQSFPIRQKGFQPALYISIEQPEKLYQQTI